MDCFGNYLGNRISGTSTDAGTGTTISCTDEDSNNIMLASSHPKKRTGRKKFKETRHPVYRGVRMRNSNRWVCEVREPGKRNRIWLGTYPTPEMAARAHDVAAIALRGLNTCLNFADSAWRLPKPASTDPEDIQRAAAEAAEMFNTENQEDEEEEEEEEEEKAPVNQEMMTGVAGQSSNGDQKSMTNYETQISHHQQSSKFYYMDDEAIFDMPGLLNDMAEGLLLPPPSYHLDSDFEWDDNNADDQDMMLWNHSV